MARHLATRSSESLAQLAALDAVASIPLVKVAAVLTAFFPFQHIAPRYCLPMTMTPSSR